MEEYQITWTIELAADNHLDATKEALKIMQDTNSEALTFSVVKLSTKEEHLINLLED